MRGKKHGSVFGLVVPVLLVLVILSMVHSLILTAGQIYTKQQELDNITTRVQEQQAENDELSRQLENNDYEIIEQAARSELGYVGPNERVFVDMTGK